MSVKLMRNIYSCCFKKMFPANSLKVVDCIWFGLVAAPWTTPKSCHRFAITLSYFTIYSNTPHPSDKRWLIVTMTIVEAQHVPPVRMPKQEYTKLANNSFSSNSFSKQPTTFCHKYYTSYASHMHQLAQRLLSRGAQELWEVRLHQTLPNRVGYFYWYKLSYITLKWPVSN